MTVKDKPKTGASSALSLTWGTVDWDHAEEEVKRLQMRIAEAVKQKRYGKVKALQWLLTHSFYAKLLAIRRVTQNTGAKTPGIDGVVWRTPNQKIQAVHSLKRRGYQPIPTRRIYIPKKQGGKRPLSIPCMKDRAMQALHNLALVPVMETKADKNSYGFRPKRSCADAIAQCFIVLAKKTSPWWILEGDIKACFDRVSAEWLKDHIITDTVILSKWLNAGYMEKDIFYPTNQGVPQGGILSPTLLVLALKGLEETIKKVASGKDKVHVVTYADDFIITGASEALLRDKIMPVVATFLKDRGLELSVEKTSITRIDIGFDFLGFSIRKYKEKLLIKPSKRSIKSLLDSIRMVIKSNKTVKTEELIRQLNPKIRGWANYHRHVVSKKIFNYIDHNIFMMIMRWIKRRHPEKSSLWIYNKYFRTKGLNRWMFSTKIKDKKGNYSFLDLFKAAQMPIRRHIKVRAEANPFDPHYEEYFLKRERSKKIRRDEEQGCHNSALKSIQIKPINSRVT